jgi:hypothetical protein
MKNCCIEYPNGELILWCLLGAFFEKIEISNFEGISKFLKLIVFGQILAKFGSFGQILMH